MKNKRIENVKMISLRLDNKSYPELETLTKEYKVSVNTILNWAVEEYLKNRKEHVQKA